MGILICASTTIGNGALASGSCTAFSVSLFSSILGLNTIAEHAFIYSLSHLDAALIPIVPCNVSGKDMVLSKSISIFLTDFIMIMMIERENYFKILVNFILLSFLSET